MTCKPALVVLLGCVVLSGWCLTAAAAVRQVHQFKGRMARAKSPEYTQFVEYAGRCYGATSRGGPFPALDDDGYGIVFSVRSDGTDFKVLHEFRGGSTDGANPFGRLVIDAARNQLYGTTANGGTDNYGTVFRMNLDGSGYSLLRDFDTLDGIHPYGSLLLSGNTLFGMTCQGGAGSDDLGTVFKIITNGSGFQVFHDFAGGTNDGAHPFGGLTLSGSTLWGTTSAGGDQDKGTLFEIQTDGSGFQVRHEFGLLGQNDGETPYGDLLLDGSTLYGMTSAGGGSGNQGILFSFTADTHVYSVLHGFSGSATDGATPFGSLALSGVTLYGTTSAGGASGLGTVFSCTLSGSAFVVLHSFSGYIDNDGALPKGSLLVASNGRLIGMTREGGPYSASPNDELGFGTLFSLLPDGSGYQMLTGFGYGPDGSSPCYQTPFYSGGRFYGMTQYGGYSDAGVLFSVSASDHGYVTIHEFGGTLDGGAVDGAYPQGSPLVYNGVVYGVTSLGGENDGGTIFKANPDGTGYTILRSLDESDGIEPIGGLVAFEGVLYGTTSRGGGTSSSGTIFRIGIDGSSFQVLHAFNGPTEGQYPRARLLLAGATLYGTCSEGGDNGMGSVFSCATGGDFDVLHTFAGGFDDGASPYGGVTMSGTTLYGLSQSGGTEDLGTIYALDTSTGLCSVLHSFQEGSPSDGAAPEGTPLLVSGTLYGLTRSGGTANYGTLFSISTDTADYAVQHSFQGYPSDGSSPQGSLTQLDGSLYGMARLGGSWDMGTVFAYTPGLDADGDGVPEGTDCDDSDPTVWSLPSEPLGLEISGTVPTTVSWWPCDDAGGTQAIVYDFLRSSSAGDWSGAACLASGTSDCFGVDSELPGEGVCFFYLPRADDTCGGNMGYTSEGIPRTGASCP